MDFHGTGCPGTVRGRLDDFLAAASPSSTRARLRNQVAGSDDSAAALDEQDVAPAAVVLADPFPCSDYAETGSLMKCSAGGVFGEDAGLNGPDSRVLGGRDERIQELAADTPAAGAGVDVDGMPDNSRVYAAAGHGRGRNPAEDIAGGERDIAVTGQPGGAELRPSRSRGLEGGVALIDARLVDREYGGRMLGSHGRDLHDLDAFLRLGEVSRIGRLGQAVTAKGCRSGPRG